MTPQFRTVRHYVLNALRSEILNGQHPAGARLRQEEVAKRLAVSTTPVREAFRDLLAEGLVTIDAHKGVVCRGLTAAGVQEIYELRIMLEPLLARRASALIGAAELADAAASHERMRITQDPEAWSILNESFHAHLTGCLRATKLYEVSAGLAAAARPYVVLSMHVQPEIFAANDRDHEQILQAFQRGDGNAAYDFSEAHLTNTMNAIIACVSRAPGQHDVSMKTAG
jgi:DNA-binding GntR family transcriptional regulator